MFGYLIVLESELHLFQYWKGDRINQDHRTVDTTCVAYQDLLVALLEWKEFGFGSVHGMFVVKADEVFSTVVWTDRDTLLRLARALLDIPDLKNPVWVEGIDTTTTLITDHVNYVVMLQRRSRAQIDRL